MTWAALVEQTALACSLGEGEARTVLCDVFARIAVEVELGGRLSVPGFGVFMGRTRKARTIRAPNGQLMRLPATEALGFKAAKRQSRQVAP